MNRKLNGRGRLLAATSLAAGLVGLTAAPNALAQMVSKDGHANSSGQTNEIVVTATRRATNLQATPVAISVVGGKKLASLGIENLFSAGPFLPGVTINGTAGYGNFPLGIRGVASSTSLIGSDDPVAVYIDGVYVGKPSAVMADLLDIDHVEIVRGPQGTLYGRNASAGAILLVHQDPSSTPEFSADTSYGSFGRWQIDGRAAGPLADDLKGSIALSHTDMSGWGDNTYNNTKAVRREATSGAGALVMETGQLKVTLKSDFVDETVHDGLKKINAIPYNTADPVVADDSLAGNPNTYAFNYPTVYHRLDGGLSLDAELSLGGGATLHSVSGYRYDQLNGTIDTDGTAANLNTNETDEGLNEFQETLYATGGGDWGSWIGGVDFYKGLTTLQQLVGVPVAASSLDIFATNDDSSGALFGEFTRKLPADFSLTVGGRLSTENKRFEDRGVGAGVLVGASAPDTLLNKTWSAFTPSARLSYEPSKSFLAYVSVASGFKSGGFTALQPTAFDPEHVITYEVGAKTSWFEQRLTLDGDLYYSDYKDLQVRVPVGVGVIQTLNAAAASIKGAELEGRWQATDQLSFSGFVDYTDAQYDDYIGPGNIQNRGQYLNRAPKWQDGATAHYDQPLFNGVLSGEITYAYRTRIFFSAPNLDGLSSPPFNQVDARIAYESPDHHWVLALVGKNLTDDRHIDNVIVFATNLVASFNEPRSYEVRLSYRY